MTQVPKKVTSAQGENPWGDLKPLEVSSSFFRFEKIYDGVGGTIVDIQYEIPSGKFDFDSDHFELIVDHGFYHTRDGQKVVLESGSRITVPIKYAVKTSATKKARTLKLGQKVVFALTEKIDTDKGNPFKNIEIYSDGTIDEEWLKENRPSPLSSVQKAFGGKIDTAKGNPVKNIQFYSDGTIDEEWLKENRPSPLSSVQKAFGGEIV